MIISHKKKFIFIAIPKTGTTAIESVLQTFNEENVPKHTQLTDIHKYMKIDLADYFIFSFVRNPWDWLVSSYFQYKKPHLKEFDSSIRRALYDISNNKPFDEFIHFFFEKMSTQIDLICDEDKKIGVNFIGQFENLQEDFDMVCDSIGIPKQVLPIKNKNQFNQKHYYEYYTPEALKLVRDKYHKEIYMFNYRFETKNVPKHLKI